VDLASEIERARANPRCAFGSYLLLGEIGRGGMGIVHRAWHEGLKRVVALKTIAGGSAGEAGIKRFYREAEAVARLDHPNIVAVHDVGQFNGTHYLVMDFVEGTTLDRRLKERGAPGERGSLALAKQVEVVRDVARAVHYAHEHGVIHRDLKPQNIMLDERDRPRVLDFGLAHVEGTGALTKTGAMIGTIGYMPPEQAGQAQETDVRSDVYALGATLYHVLTGRAPFVGGTALETLTALLTRKPAAPSSLNPGVPGKLEAIAMRCLEKDPGKRYQTAAALAHDLDVFVEGKPLARTGGLALPAKLGLGALALACGLGGVLGALAFFPGDKPDRKDDPVAPLRSSADASGSRTKPPPVKPSIVKSVPLPPGNWRRIVVDPSIHRLVVSSELDPLAVVLKTDDLTLEKYLPLSFVTLDPTTHRFYGSQQKERAVSAWDGTTLEQLWQKDQPAFIPNFLQVDPELARLYVVNQGGNGDDPIIVYDMKTGETIGKPVGVHGVSGAVLVDPRTHELFAASGEVNGQNTAVLRSGPSGLELEELVPDMLPHAVDPRRKRILCARQDPKGARLVLLDPETNAVQATPTVVPWSCAALDVAGDRIFEGGLAGKVAVLALESLTVVDTLSLEDGYDAEALAVDPDGRTLYVAGVPTGSGGPKLFAIPLPAPARPR